MAYSEGLMGFQRGFSPRVAARARYLRTHPQLHFVVLAPLFCMGFFHATRRRRIMSFALTAGIVALVLAVRLLPQPWRGIVDAGVVVGLAWGLLSLIVFSARALGGADFAASPEVPDV
jgi:FtsH-binding integral membrane protein